MNKAVRASGLLGSFLTVLVASSLLIAQDSKKPDAKKPANRLPSNYGKLELSEEQRTKIYAIQASFDPKIDDLTAQLAALKAKQKTEIEAVLKPDQAKKLAELQAAAKAKAAAAKAAKEKEAAKPTAPTDTKKPVTEKK